MYSFSIRVCTPKTLSFFSLLIAQTRLGHCISFSSASWQPLLHFSSSMKIASESSSAFMLLLCYYAISSAFSSFSQGFLLRSFLHFLIDTDIEYFIAISSGQTGFQKVFLRLFIVAEDCISLQPIGLSQRELLWLDRWEGWQLFRGDFSDRSLKYTALHRVNVFQLLDGGSASLLLMGIIDDGTHFSTFSFLTSQMRLRFSLDTDTSQLQDIFQRASAREDFLLQA